MRTKVLKPDEVDRSQTPELAPALPYVSPDNVDVVVVEDASGRVVAAITVLRVTHYEGAWIAPEHRGNPGIVRALLRGAEKIADERSERWVMWGAGDGDEFMHSLLREHGGVEIPARFFAKGVEVCRKKL